MSKGAKHFIFLLQTYLLRLLQLKEAPGKDHEMILGHEDVTRTY